MCPPHSPTRTTNDSILKLAGAFHCVKTSRIRFWAFSYSRGEPCERSNQLIMYFIGFHPIELKLSERQSWLHFRGRAGKCQLRGFVLKTLSRINATTLIAGSGGPHWLDSQQG